MSYIILIQTASLFTSWKDREFQIKESKSEYLKWALSTKNVVGESECTGDTPLGKVRREPGVSAWLMINPPEPAKHKADPEVSSTKQKYHSTDSAEGNRKQKYHTRLDAAVGSTKQ